MTCWRTPFHGDERGLSAVEFALLAPFLMIIVMGIVEFGLILYTFNTAESAARDVARQLATNRITSTQASTAVSNELPAWAKTSAVVTVSQSTPTTPATNKVTLDVTMPMSVATPTHFLSWAYSGRTLHSAVSLPQEVAP